MRPAFLFEACRTTRLDADALLGDPALAAFDPELDSVLNLNEPADYDAARARPAPEVTVRVFGALRRVAAVSGDRRSYEPRRSPRRPPRSGWSSTSTWWRRSTATRSCATPRAPRRAATRSPSSPPTPAADARPRTLLGYALRAPSPAATSGGALVVDVTDGARGGAAARRRDPAPVHRRGRPGRVAHAPSAPPGVDPLAPRRRWSSASRPLVGTPLTTWAKFAVVAKSPLTDRSTMPCPRPTSPSRASGPASTRIVVARRVPRAVGPARRRRRRPRWSPPPTCGA